MALRSAAAVKLNFILLGESIDDLSKHESSLVFLDQFPGQFWAFRYFPEVIAIRSKERGH